MLLLSLALLSPALLGCGCRDRRPGPSASGTGYGVGIPRQAIILGRTPQSRGETTLGFPDPAHPPESRPWDSVPTDAGAAQAER
jgi:hypothetical protein